MTIRDRIRFARLSARIRRAAQLHANGENMVVLSRQFALSSDEQLAVIMWADTINASR